MSTCKQNDDNEISDVKLQMRDIPRGDERLQVGWEQRLRRHHQRVAARVSAGAELQNHFAGRIQNVQIQTDMKKLIKLFFPFPEHPRPGTEGQVQELHARR